MSLRNARPLPLYQQLKNDILAKVRSGVYEAGGRLPGELELSEIYGLSRSTVRQALLNLQDEGLLVRARGKGTYISSDYRPAVESGSEFQPIESGPLHEESGVIALIAPSPHIYLMPRIIASMQRTLDEHGLGLVVYDTDDDPIATELVIDRALSEGAVGLIIQPPEETAYSRRCHELQRKGFPIVMCDRPYRRVPCDCVMTDNLAGGFTATSHLVSLGHKHISFVSFTGMETVSVSQRYEGYLTALDVGGIEADSSLVLASPMRSYRDRQEHNIAWSNSIKDLLNRKNRPTAIFAVNDRVAMDIIRLAEQQGLRVPNDLAVVGFDNSDLAPIYRVPLTTVEQPLAEVGRTAAELLLERLGGISSETRCSYLRGMLIIRRSCGSQLYETLTLSEKSDHYEVLA